VIRDKRNGSYSSLITHHLSPLLLSEDQAFFRPFMYGNALSERFVSARPVSLLLQARSLSLQHFAGAGNSNLIQEVWAGMLLAVLALDGGRALG
jgi:hypothetical protein